MKKICCLLLAISLLLCSCPVVSTAEISEENEHIFSYRDVDFTVERASVSRSGSSGEIPSLTETTQIPASYSSVSEGKISTAKHQGSYGSCWAFSATNSAEASMKSNGYKLYDLSPLQLVYFFYNNKIDPLGNALGDSTKNLTDTRLNLGGNHVFTMWALAGWTNATTESILPYSSSNCVAANNGNISNDYAYNYDVAHLQNAYILPYSTNATDMNNIKSAIIRYGSAACSYYHDDNNMNTNYYAYYSTATKTNHAVSIVGWNDNYPKSNFKVSSSGSDSWLEQIFGKKDKIPANGAWLIKNSWGSSWGTDGDTNPTHSRKEGYFWLSYYDASIAASDKVFIYDYLPADTYKYNYQYDGSCGTSTIELTSGQKAAAIYTVKGLTSDYESIDAVGIGISSANETGTVYLYADPNSGKPESGKLLTQQSFSTVYPGYHTIKINNAPLLQKGQSYSVVFKFNSAAKIFVDSSYKNADWIEFKADTSKDKTYLISSSRVTDMGQNSMTARIKAYTNDYIPPVTTCTVSFDANNGTNPPEEITKTVGTDITLPTGIPVRNGYKFLGWALDKNASKPDYKAGDAFAKDEDTVLYAVWQIISATSVSVTPSSVTLIEGGEAKEITLSALPDNCICNWLLANANDCGTYFTYEGLKLIQDGNKFSVQAETYNSDNITLYFYESNSNKYVLCTVNVIPQAQSVSIEPETLTLTAGGEAKEITLSALPDNCICNWLLANANDCGTYFTYGGLKLIQDGNKFSVQAETYDPNEITLYFYESNSGKYALCTVNTEPKKATSLSLSEDSIELTVGGDGKTVTVLPDALDSVCELTIVDAEKDGNVYTANGLTVTQDGNSFLIKADSFLSNTVTLVFRDIRSETEAVCTVNIKKPVTEEDLSKLSSTVFSRMISSIETFDKELDVNNDGKLDIRDIVCMKKMIADNKKLK